MPEIKFGERIFNKRTADKSMRQNQASARKGYVTFK